MPINNNLTLHPANYLKLETPLILYFNDKPDQKKADKHITPEQFESVLETMTEQKVPIAVSGNLGRGSGGEYWYYTLYTPSFCVGINESTTADKNNFNCNYYKDGEQVKKWYNSPFSQMFLIEPAGGIYLIYKKVTYFVKTPGCDSEYNSGDTIPNAEWSMDDHQYELLLDKMHSYFLGEDDFVRDASVSREMEANVLTPFENFTEKEHEYEERSIDFTNALPFFRRESVDKNTNYITYAFCSNDPKADPEKVLLEKGNRIIIYDKDGNSTPFVGILYEIDDTSAEDGVLFHVDFYKQFNDKDLPEEGFLFVHQNDSQCKVRRAVAKTIRRGITPAKYMYKTFRDFSVDGYHSPEQDLIPFLQELTARQYPPNQMQMETIIKGILTKDLLLVLGPPGTGKTTVILSWVEYFLKKGMRVLVSSQNNAAVDNVLERFKGRGEIVRLGRESKVQDNCKEFLPSNKVASMRARCEENRLRVKTGLAEDIQQINKYRSALTELLAAAEDYEQKQKEFKAQCEAINTLSAQLSDNYDQYMKSKVIVKLLREETVRQEIFLEESRKKNAFVRFFMKGIVNKVERELRPKKKELADKIAVCNNAADRHVDYVSQLMDQLNGIRNSEQYLGIFAAHDRLLKLNADIFFGGKENDRNRALTPMLSSELSVLYTAPVFDRDVFKNLPICRAELEEMDRLETAARKIEFASDRWTTAALRNKQNNVFEEILLNVCQIVGATCVGINSNKKFANVDFDVSIIDESGQIQIHNALIPMSRAPKTLMLGDYKQIPPIANSDIIASCEADGIRTDLLKMSFFEFLFEEMRKKEVARILKNRSASAVEDGDETESLTESDARKEMLKPLLPEYNAQPKKEGEPLVSPYSLDEITRMVLDTISDRKKIVNLNSQFRMPGNISDVISEWFYENNYFSSYDISKFRPLVPGTEKPIVLINTALHRIGRKESQPLSKMGYQNKYEAELVGDIIEAVVGKMDSKTLREYTENFDEKLGIISAYGAQVRFIRDELKKRSGIPFSDAQINSAVASLDSFQGQERDLIIYSLTRSDPSKGKTQARIGFLKELRRLNVAFTRAKKQLVIIGDIDYLTECLYMDKATVTGELPCDGCKDETVTETHIMQCADCPVECERRFARFMKLLKQHIESTDEKGSPIGDLINSDDLKNLLKGKTQE